MTFPIDPEGTEAPGRAIVVGVGLIGGSIALGLQSHGWHVSGIDVDARALSRALDLGVINASGDDPQASLAFVCVPAAQVAQAATAILDAHGSDDFLVTDVAGVKATIVDAVRDPRFIGGHPMAGSEQLGVAGSREDLFVGATWVLTPGPTTPPDGFTRIVGIIRSLGAQVLSLSGGDHDRMVALVSHVPHLVAASLMNEASDAAKSDAALLQLAAGGFRDMTRVAAGDPGIWPDVCIENRTAIVEGLDELLERLAALRVAISDGDAAQIHAILERASGARRSLPGRATDPTKLAQVRIPVPDQPGVIAEVTAAASDLGVSLFDVEIAHSVEGDRGVLIVVVAVEEGERYGAELRERGFTCSVTLL